MCDVVFVMFYDIYFINSRELISFYQSHNSQTFWLNAQWSISNSFSIILLIREESIINNSLCDVLCNDENIGNYGYIRYIDTPKIDQDL